MCLYEQDGRFWVGDGWHRIAATDICKRASVTAIVSEGGRQAALLKALSANSRHGLRRTNADKRRAVEVAVAAYPDWSNGKVAEACGVSEGLVRKVTKESEQVRTVRTSENRVGRDGKVYHERPTPPAQPEVSSSEIGTARDVQARTSSDIFANDEEFGTFDVDFPDGQQPNNVVDGPDETDAKTDDAKPPSPSLDEEVARLVDAYGFSAVLLAVRRLRPKSDAA